MALFVQFSAGSDEDEDLESLRIAALQSLKPKTDDTSKKLVETKPKTFQPNFRSTFGSAQTTRHNGKSFRNGSNRGRNGLFARTRTNTNLIAIQPIDHSEAKENMKNDGNSDVNKLVLPQDRYCKQTVCSESSQEMVTNKFDRYDNSENSDSDSDAQSETGDNPKIERDNSVERLISEIDSEINVLMNNGEKTKPKPEETKNVETADSNTSENVNDSACLLITPDVDDVVQITNEEKLFDEDEKLDTFDNVDTEEVERSHSPLESKSPIRTHTNKRKSKSRSPPIHDRRSPYHLQRSRSPPRKRYSPVHTTRPLSPLIFSDMYSTMTLAPLSPRSAAFVLQNQEILARRKKSPRRSPSRDSNIRRSLSPRRSDLSPGYHSPGYLPRCSQSPRRRSLSPKRTSLSPRSRRSPNKYVNVPKSRSPVQKPIHKRLGNRSKNNSPYLDRNPDKKDVPKRRRSRSLSLSLSPSPERNYTKRPLNETTGYIRETKTIRDKPRKDKKPQDEKPINSVLEARKRKFEAPVNLENGKISLKSVKEEATKPEPETVSNIEESEEEYKDEMFEKELEDGFIELNPSINDLWSDEESNSENEGRFKSNPNSQTRNVTVLPFTKLTEKSAPKPLSQSQLSKDSRDRNRKRTHGRRSRSPAKRKRENKSQNKDDKYISRDRISESTKQENTVIDNDKKKEVVKEIKDKVKVDEQKSDKPIRKVNVEKDNTLDSDEPEIIIDNEDEPLTTSTKEDDLRAELSRRRAQRMMKAGPITEVPSRLLKSALEDVVPKQCLKKLKGSIDAADRRVLILKRLIANSATKAETATEVSKTSTKLPIHMRLGISNVELSAEDPVRTERRSKRSRSGRRKKAASQKSC